MSIHPLTLPEQVGPALQEDGIRHPLSLRTSSYDCVFPQGSYIPRRRQTQTSYSENKGVTKPSRGKIRAIRVETWKSAVGKASVRVARDQEPEDSR